MFPPTSIMCVLIVHMNHAPGFVLACCNHRVINTQCINKGEIRQQIKWRKLWVIVLTNNRFFCFLRKTCFFISQRSLNVTLQRHYRCPRQHLFSVDIILHKKKNNQPNKTKQNLFLHPDSGVAQMKIFALLNDRTVKKKKKKRCFAGEGREWVIVVLFYTLKTRLDCCEMKTPSSAFPDFVYYSHQHHWNCCFARRARAAV